MEKAARGSLRITFAIRRRNRKAPRFFLRRAWREFSKWGVCCCVDDRAFPEDHLRMSDWIEHLQRHAEAAGAELVLDTLRAGDLLQVETMHTLYSLRMLGSREAELKTDRADRPAGRVWINGCTFGGSTSIKPGHLFCDGNLEFRFREGRMVHTTTAIREIRVVRRAVWAEE
jgi:hypothetical protein